MSTIKPLRTVAPRCLRELEPANSHSTVNDQHLTVNVTRLCRAEPDCSGSHFTRLSAAPGGKCRNCLLCKGRVLRAGGSDHWRLGPSWGHGVDSDVVSAIFHRRDTRQPLNSILRGRVCAHSARPG